MYIDLIHYGKVFGNVIFDIWIFVGLVAIKSAQTLVKGTIKKKNIETLKVLLKTMFKLAISTVCATAKQIANRLNAKPTASPPPGLLFATTKNSPKFT